VGLDVSASVQLCRHYEIIYRIYKALKYVKGPVMQLPQQFCVPNVVQTRYLVQSKYVQRNSSFDHAGIQT
jgi:hypothetical protein